MRKVFFLKKVNNLTNIINYSNVITFQNRQYLLFMIIMLIEFFGINYLNNSNSTNTNKKIINQAQVLAINANKMPQDSLIQQSYELKDTSNNSQTSVTITSSLDKTAQIKTHETISNVTIESSFDRRIEQRNYSALNNPISQKFINPLNSWNAVTTYFSLGHPGVDLTAPFGAPVYAIEKGKILEAGWSSIGYGYSVLIEHENNYVSRYAHLSAIYVTYGDIIPQGFIIGRVGCTGRCTGNHLHFEIYKNSIPINPFTSVL